MTPEEAISLLKNQQVIQQMIELTRDPAVVKRLSDIAGGETARQQLMELLQNADVAKAVTSLVQQTDFYQRLHGLMWAGAILVGVGIGLLALTLLLALYNAALLRRLLKERKEE
jgi:hypothetical protein